MKSKYIKQLTKEIRALTNVLSSGRIRPLLNSPTVRLSVKKMNSVLYDFSLMKAPGGNVEILCVDLNPDAEISTFFIAEGPFSSEKVAKQFIEGNKIGKPWNQSRINF